MSSILDHIDEILNKHLTPQILDIKDESALHSGPKGTVTHCQIIIVSEQFTTMSLLERHRLIYQLIKAENINLHAISIKAYSPSEWQMCADKPKISPACRGGYGR